MVILASSSGRLTADDDDDERLMQKWVCIFTCGKREAATYVEPTVISVCSIKHYGFITMTVLQIMTVNF